MRGLDRFAMKCTRNGFVLGEGASTLTSREWRYFLGLPSPHLASELQTCSRRDSNEAQGKLRDAD